jgi:hypothetical protein
VNVTEVRANRSRVRFDFEGSLAHARQLWALADRLEAARHARRVDADAACASWRGRYGDEFRALVDSEQADFVRVVGGLRAEAQAWAVAWRDAMNEQNRRSRAQQVDLVRSRRAVGEQLVDVFVGDDSDVEVPPAPWASVPVPPGFVPTCDEVRY